MVDYGIVKSTVKPNETETDDFSVWVNSNIIENDNVENGTEYEYNQKQYTKDEYDILIGVTPELTQDEQLEQLAMKMVETQKQLTVSQEALDFVLMGGI